MGWFKLAGEGAFHAKVLEAGNEAYGVWCRAGQWSAQHLTDGRIPRAVAMTISLGDAGPWAKLVEARGGGPHGLAEATEGGWQIHDYLDWNPSAEEERAKSAARAEAGARGARARLAPRDGEGPPKQTADPLPSKVQANAEQTPSVCLANDQAKPKPVSVSVSVSDPETGDRISPGGGDPGPVTNARAKGSQPPRVAPPRDGPEHEILEALRRASDGTLRSEATLEFAQSLSRFANSGGSGGRLDPEDIVLGVEQAAELVAAERAGPDHVPRAGPDLRKYVTGIVRRIRRGEARDAAKRWKDPGADETSQRVMQGFCERWSAAHGGRTYIASDADPETLAGLLPWAQAEARRRGYDSPEAALLRAVEAFVRDPEPRLADKAHPVSWMPAWLRAYELPVHRPAGPRATRPAGERQGGPPPAEVLAAMAAGPGGAPVRRPGCTA